MGCPGGTRSVFMHAFWAILHQNTAKRSVFPLQSFSRKIKEKLARRTRVNTERVYRIVLMPPGHSIILLKSN